MNYWPAEICALAECHQPLFDHLERMRIHGRKVAREMYGCRGFVAHHNTDIYADCAPQDNCMSSTFWVMGAAWLSTHLWTHYAYTKDQDFLLKAYPIMAEAALFFLDYMEEKERISCHESIFIAGKYLYYAKWREWLCMHRFCYGYGNSS